MIRAQMRHPRFLSQWLPVSNTRDSTGTQQNRRGKERERERQREREGESKRERDRERQRERAN